MKNLLSRLVREEEGQDLVEYAFLVSGIALLAYVGVTTLGGAISDYYVRLSASDPITAAP